MNMTKFDFSIEDGIARIRMIDPEHHNTVNLAFAREFADIGRQCQNAPDLRLVLLSAEGDSFSFGGDIDEFLAKRDVLTPHVREMADNFHVGITNLRQLDAPIVAAVNGMAAGGGFSLVLVADLAIAKQSARFNVAYTRSGLTPDGGSTYFLPRQVGFQRAFDLMATNPTLTADQALELGIVARVVDDDRFEDEVEAIVSQLAGSSGHALASLKGLLRASMQSDLATQLANEAESISTIAATEQTLGILDAFVARSTSR